MMKTRQEALASADTTYTPLLADLNDVLENAQGLVSQKVAELTERKRLINAYYDALENADETQQLLDNPPEEVL